MTALVLGSKNKENDDKTKYDTFCSTSKTETVINKNGIDNIFESIYTKIISITANLLGKTSGWINDSAIDRNINISKYYLLTGSIYIKLATELDHRRKVLQKLTKIFQKDLNLKK